MSTHFIETIKIEDGQVFNIKWHNLRFNRTQKEIFKIDTPLNLQDYIKHPPQKGLFRCRILYSNRIKSVEYIPYKIRDIESLKILQSDISYSYKYANRELLDSLKDSAGSDDIIIQKDGLLTDTTIANIAFYDGDSWVTPQSPLLEGTMRAKLIDRGFLITKDIKSDNLNNFSNFALMNAMIGFQIKKNIRIY
jgi:4-amino-4-deoxychorismate lyase